MKPTSGTTEHETGRAPRLRSMPGSMATGGTLPDVVWLDDLLDEFRQDDTGLPPLEEEDGHRHEPSCVYDGPSEYEDEDFGDLDREPDERACTEKPEYYIRARSEDPLDDTTRTFYYCPRHFALNLGYLCDVMSRRGPALEIRHFVDQGRLPDRMTIQSWGPIGQLPPDDTAQG
ncbi:hypothetical protein D2E23_0622 [Bifidobacterium callimiconis]|uniref:Uncharacterized protein n=2 Tax=Bifidobacterium callimiconis TaxID=2306973 RepID=A0A430FGI9_9BIFI|nr:hypothetical protein D2E23_0622 [Bifidobacterium callimiconis]